MDANSTATPQWRRDLEGWLSRPEARVEDRFAQLATVRADGWPANRTVVVRRFLDTAGMHEGVALHADSVCVAVDARSGKVEQARTRPFGELCWYLRQPREQYRLMGPLVVVAEDEPLAGVRVRLWRSLSAATQAMFAPPAVFAVLVLAPWRVEWLRLCEPGPHQAAHEQRLPNGAWLREPVVPN